MQTIRLALAGQTGGIFFLNGIFLGETNQAALVRPAELPAFVLFFPFEGACAAAKIYFDNSKNELRREGGGTLTRYPRELIELRFFEKNASSPAAEYQSGRVVMTEYIDDTVKHKIISEFESAENGESKLLSRRVEYRYGIPAPVKDPRLIPFCFFEAVKAGAYKEASAYLAAVLRQNIPEGGEEIFYRDFFGPVSGVRPNFYFREVPEAVALTYQKENGYEAKLFIAEMSGGLISNISEFIP